MAKPTQAQPIIEWEKTIGGTINDRANDIEITQDGNYIVVGQSNSSDEDIGKNFGKLDGYIAKLNSAGNILWKKVYGGSENDQFLDVKITNNGEIILVGITSSEDQDINSKGQSDCWLVKLDQNGNLLWQTTFGGTSSDRGRSVDLTSNGFYIVGSTASNNGDFTFFRSNPRGFVMKVDNDGNLLNLTYSGLDFYSVHSTLDGGYIATGEWQQGGQKNLHVIKGIPLPDSQGFNTQFSKDYGGSKTDRGTSVIESIDGNYIISGFTESTDGIVTDNKGAIDTWVIKIDRNGDFIWDRTLGGSKIDVAENIIESSDDNFLIIGSSSSIDGDVTHKELFQKTNPSRDVWIVKLNQNGEIQWNKTIGGKTTDVGKTIKELPNKSFIIGGYTKSTDGNIKESKGGEDAWIVKLDLDSDSDGLPDTWEKFGLDTDGDGSIDLPLHSKPYDADYLHKDIFLEIDWMKPEYKPNALAIEQVIKAFDKAPVENPDGIDGITLHVDYGQFSNGNESEGELINNQFDKTVCFFPMRKGPCKNSITTVNFYDIKNTHFNSVRKKVFHYAIFANSPKCDKDNGMPTRNGGIAEILGNDLIISLGQNPVKRGYANSKIVSHILMHELGHNLGLKHGGGDGNNNKPNYHSIMNYKFLYKGVPPGNILDYSSQTLATIVNGAGELIGYDDWQKIRFDFQDSYDFDDGNNFNIQDEEIDYETVKENNLPPVADAGNDTIINICASSQIKLNGSKSFDPENSSLTFTWNGPFLEGDGIINGSDPNITLAPGLSMIELEVDDGIESSKKDTVLVTIISNGIDNDNDGVCNNQDCNDNDSSIKLKKGEPCDDGNPNTIGEIILEDCSCGIQNSNFDCPEISKNFGDSCNDGDICTINDKVQLDCSCAGTFQDSDDDGTCDAQDLCNGGPEPDSPCDDGTPNTSGEIILADCSCGDGSTIFDCLTISKNIGDACDDGDICTTNDVVQADCSCAGAFQDSDNDDTCDAQDLCNGSPEPDSPCDDGNPNTTGETIQPDCSCGGGSIIFNCPTLQKNINDPCDDGNPNTTNDQVQPNCTCQGTPINTGGTANCQNLQFDGSNGQIKVSGLTAAQEKIEILGRNTDWQVVLICENDCNDPHIIPNLQTGTYKVKVQMYGNDGSYCYHEEEVNVIGANCPDTDQDGTCDDQDKCNGQAEPDSPCDDGNANTRNDKIQPDCSCKGEIDNNTGGTVDCTALSFSVETGQVTVGNLTGQYQKIEIIGRETGWQIVGICDRNCSNPQIIRNLKAGEYKVKVQLYGADNSYCYQEETVVVPEVDCSDSDGDGVCDEMDICVGMPEPGTPCDDGDANTKNDQIQTDCSCKGTINNTNEPCANFQLNMENGQLLVSNLTAPIEILDLFNEHWQPIYNCTDNCAEPTIIEGLSRGKYHITIKSYTANWEFICRKTITFNITNSGVEIVNQNRSTLKIDKALVYPNPAGDKVNIQFVDMENGEGQIHILNYLGKEMYFLDLDKINSAPISLNTSNWPNGIYLVQIKLKNRKIITKKLIINRLY